MLRRRTTSTRRRRTASLIGAAVTLPVAAAPALLVAAPARAETDAPDTTPPAVAGQVVGGFATENGWFDRPSITYRTTATDPDVPGAVTSGFDRLFTELDGVQRPASTVSPTDVTVTGEGTHVLKWAALDRAGNPSVVASQSINIDSVKPVVTVRYPAPDAVLTPRSSTKARLSCTDATSGLTAPCRTIVDGVTVGSGGATLDLTPGAHVLQVFARDLAGNIGAQEVRYSVPGAEKPSTTRITATDVAAGRRGTVTVETTCQGGPTGPVELLDGETSLGTGDLVHVPDSARARAVIDVAALRPGLHKLRAEFPGSLLCRPSTSKVVKVTVR